MGQKLIWNMYIFRWNQMDLLIVIFSIVGIIFDGLQGEHMIPINPTILRVMRILRIVRGNF
jgi:hypothetical protein